MGCWGRILGKRIEDYKTAINSLDGFIQQIYWGEELTPEQSKENIKQGLVQITLNLKSTLFSSLNEESCSNGLLITEDGYFLTAKHCVDHSYSQGTIKDSQGKQYSIEKVCAVSKKNPKDPKQKTDLALVKARIEGPSQPMRYRIFNTYQLKKELPVKLLSYKDGKLKEQYGIVKKLHDYRIVSLKKGRYTYFPDSFVVHLSTAVESGQSGGTIVCPEGRLVGIINSAGEDLEGFFVEKNALGGSKFMRALELVDFYKRKLLKKLG